MNVDGTTTLSDIATTVPGAAAVFERHRLDYCCGGKRTLHDACRERDIDPAELADEIAGAACVADDSARWDRAPLDALITHLVEHYHARLRRELPRLIALATKVERVHAAKPSCPRGLREHLVAMADAVASHLMKEEQVLFPLISRHAGQIGMPIRVLMHEHLDHGATLERTRALTRDLTPPADACATWRALYLGLAELEAELHRHIHLENNVLFPRALQAA